MKQVTYTHLDGNVTIFTANTVIENTVMRWDANANVHVSNTDISYVYDWGLGIWADERLTPDELTKFTETAMQWGAVYNLNEHVYDIEDFKEYWAKFIQDPNVKVEE